MRLKWSEKIAYAIGLITTDGSLSRDGRHITLVSKDIQLLQTFRECLKLKNRIRIKPPGGYSKKCAYMIQFGNVIFYRWLKEIGLMPNKTYDIGELEIPSRYFTDFLRGHLDGDGSIFIYKDRYMTYKKRRYSYFRIYTAFNSASYEHLHWIRNRLKEELNISGALNHWLKKERTVPLWTLRFAKNESLELLRWLYYKPNLPCLRRKRNLALKIMKSSRFSNFYLASDKKLL